MINIAATDPDKEKVVQIRRLDSASNERAGGVGS